MIYLSIMNRFLLSFLVISIFTFVACDDDGTGSSTPAPSEPLDYSGVWSGNFSGGDEGLLEMTVSADNSMTGRGYSTNIKQYFTFSGNLNTDGYLDGAESSLKTTFIGQFADSTASGTWSNASGSIKGEWSLER